MRNRNVECEECNGHISYESDTGNYRCNECGVITDNEGVVLYEYDETMSNL